MEAARNAVSSFLGQGGKQHTDVDESVNPAVTSETVKPHRHEETTEAVDREIHQDHYHTTVQPVQDKETLPETHQHNVAPQVDREFRHGDVEQDRSRVGAELGQFKDSSTTQQTTHSSAAAPSQTGEHVHHHVHEQVQPVIHKETIQPEVVHTTIPIHEKHIAPSEHHGMSQLPTKSMAEFQGMGTALTGGARSHEEYEGHPRGYNPELQKERKPVDVNPREHDGTHDPEKTGHFGSSGAGTSSTTGAATTGVGAATAAGHHESQHAGQGLQDSSPSISGSGHARDAAMGSNVAGVGDGHAARNLGRDHTMAHQVADLDRNDTQGTIGDSGATTAGTALGGRSDGNTVANAASAATGRNTNEVPSTEPRSSVRDAGHESSNLTGRDTENLSPAEQQGSTRETGREPTNLAGGNAEPPSKDIPADTDIQHASRQGQDPSLEKDRGGKLTGTGVDGSHSAVFGLTPDGHKFTDTKNTAGGSAAMPKAEQESTRGDPENTSSSGPGSERVADQMQEPRVAEKGHEGKAEYTDSDAKPGAGTF